MSLSVWLGPVLSGLTAGVAAHWARRRVHSRAEADAAQGKAVKVIAAIRLLDRRLIAGRWRHGKAVICTGEIRWAPRWPRIGRRIVLHNVVFRDRRRPTTPELWFLDSGLVILECSTAAGRYELAVFPETLAFLYPGMA